MTPAALRALAAARLKTAQHAESHWKVDLMVASMYRAAADRRWVITKGADWPSPETYDLPSLLRKPAPRCPDVPWLEPSWSYRMWR